MTTLLPPTLWTIQPRRLHPDALRQECLPWLDDTERERHAELKTAALRHDYLAAHALLRAALGAAAGVPPPALIFRRQHLGKPVMVAPDRLPPSHFNLSHTQGLAVVLTSMEGPVGVDVEAIDRPVDVEQVARHFLAPSASNALAALEPAARQRWFYEQWTLREALLKARGVGLAGRLDADPIAFDSAARAMVDGWRLQLFDRGKFLIAAVRAASPIREEIEMRNGLELFKAGIAVED